MPVTTDTSDWRKPLIIYLKEGKLPHDNKWARKSQVKEPSFVVDKGVSYKR